jgi:hypothetical protein
MIVKIVKLSSLILITITAVVALSVSYQLYSAQAQGANFDFAGWLWSENYGWISINSDNCLLLGPGDCTIGEDYSVKIDSGNNITGYGWSENVGWVCFGDGGGDSTKGCTGTPPEGILNTTLDESSGKITGWAKIVSLNNDGWLEVGRGDAQGANFGEACYDCQPTCDEWTIEMQGDPPLPVQVEPCITFSETDYDTCNTCFSRTNFDGANIPTPGIESVVGGSGLICGSCSSCQQIDGVAPGSSRIACNPDSGGSCSQCDLYGVNRDSSNGQLLGWGWSGTADGLDGAGWIHFNTDLSSSHIVLPWLQTIYGSIYSSGQVKQRAGVEGKNATYCIFADDINVNIKTQNCEDVADGLITDVDNVFPIKSPAQSVYRNALGKIDINGLTSKVAGGGLRNKYGQIVNDLLVPSWSGPAQALNGEVYYFPGNLSIPATGITFENGSGVQGGGTVIVDGNLYIDGNIYYDGAIPADLKGLASVAWIVRGDVIINHTVEDVVGAFLILGDGVTSCEILGGSDPNFPRYVQNSCGGLFSGESDSPLTILGLAVSKVFDFGRTYTEILQGSERVIYDGRLVANPPPGLQGFVEGLPIIRDFSY